MAIEVGTWFWIRLVVGLTFANYGASQIVPINRRYVGNQGGYGGGGFGQNPYDCIPGAYGAGGYGNGNFKPSYAYQSQYGGGGLSAYEGPYGGYTSYLQPGISYPPAYPPGGILNSGYYGSSSSYGNGPSTGGIIGPNYGGSGGPLPGYASGLSGSFPGYSSNNGGLSIPGYGLNSGGLSGSLPGYGSSSGIGSSGCRDRSADCALLASTGQCASNQNIKSICPISCGTGCNEQLQGGSITEIYNGGNSLPYSSGIGGGNGANYLGFPNQQNYGGFSFNTDFNNGFTSELQCRDSHVQGCQTWAQLGYCSSVPEFMLSYCKASCGVCSNGFENNNNGYSYAGYPAQGGGFPIGSGITSTYLNPSFFGSNNDINFANEFQNGEISSNLPLGGYIQSNPFLGFSNLGNSGLGDNDALLLSQLGGSLSGAEQLAGFNPGQQFPSGLNGLGGGNISPFPYTSYYPFRANSVFAEKREPKTARQVVTSASMDSQPATALGLAAALSNSRTSSSSLSIPQLNDKMSTVLRMDQIGS